MVYEVLEMMTYAPFWRTLEERKITTYALINKHGILPDTVQRLRSEKPITTSTIETLCEVLECRVQDIVEYIPET